VFVYELQRQVNGDQWAVGKKFNAENDDEAEKIAVELINSQRLYYGEARVRIIKTVFVGNLRELGYPIVDDEKYTEIREGDIAQKAKMYLIIEEKKKNV